MNNWKLNKNIKYNMLYNNIRKIKFLALLCATAQQSYCRHAVVRRPSVKPVFSEPVKHIYY